MVSQENLSSIVSLIQSNTNFKVTAFNGQLRFESGFRNNTEIYYKDERIDSTELEDSSDLDIYFTAYKQHTNDNIDPTDWEFVQNRNHLLEWKTPNNNRLKIKSIRQTITIEFPRKFGKDQQSVSNLSTARYIATLYQLQHDAKEVDFQECLENTVYTNLQKITGIGPNLAEKYVTREIYTYEKLLDNIWKVSGNYQEDAKEEINGKMDNGERLIDGEELLNNYSSYLTARNI